MMKRFCLLLFGLLVLCQIVTAMEDVDCFQYYKFQNGLVFDDLRAEKVVYKPGDEVIVSYNLKSQMESPIVEGSVRVQIFYNDPNQGEQMIDEFFAFDDLNLQFNDVIPQEFKWTIPAGAKAGEYVIKTYFIVSKGFNLAGLSFQPYGPPGIPGKMTTFDVENPSNSRIYFNKEETYINDVKYEFGSFIPSYSNGPVSIKTQLINEGPAKQVNLQLNVYEWDDVTDKPIREHTVEEFVSLGANEVKDFAYNLPALKTDAYEVKFVAKSSEEKSILKLRFGLEGAKGRFIYLGLDRFPLKNNEKTSVFICFSQAADYMTNFNGTIEVEVVDEHENTIAEDESEKFLIVSTPQGKKFGFTPTKDITKLILKGNIYDENENLMDHVEVIYDYSKFVNIPRRFDLAIDKTEYNIGETLSYSLSYTDDIGNPLEGRVLIYLLDSEDNIISTIPNKMISGSLFGTMNIPEKIGHYKLMARELENDLKTEKLFSLKGLEVEEKEFNYWWLIGMAVAVLILVVILWRKWK